MNLSPDSQAILLLCSHLGLPVNPDPAPLTLREWNALARKILSSPLQRPGGLLGLGMEELKKELELNEAEAQRLAILLQRSGSLAILLERLQGVGIQAMTRVDAEYPQRFRQRLKEAAPTVLFYAGEQQLLGQPGIAVVGSRHLDAAGEECARYVGNACGLSGMVLYSGGAKGVDTLSMNAALEARGSAVGVLADSLERAIRALEARSALTRGDLCLVTMYSPNAGFSVGAAMGRNRLIYCLADYAVVVASDAESGGTWSGATEALKAKWLPVFILEHGNMPEGNRLLLQRGGLPFPFPIQVPPAELPGWFNEHSQGTNFKPTPTQLGLF
jgi:predicted Rossmann fold nucleotide-binding protein DprA/Smf involved in DNA uptake